MSPLLLRTLFLLDRARFALFLARSRQWLDVEPPVSPNLRLAEWRVEPGGQVLIGRGVAAERRTGTHVWVQSGGRLELGRGSWLRTECGANRLMVFPGARLRIGERALINGAMLHAKREIRIGDDALVGFGVRVLDADGHPIDSESKENVAPVRIGNRVWIGADSIVLPGVTIGDDVVVGARSVVTKDLPPRVLAVGAPARPIREIAPRDRHASVG